MILATFSLLLLLLALVLVVVVLLLLLLLKEEYQKHLPVWQSYQIHTVHRKSPNTGALRPSISNGKWDNVLFPGALPLASAGVGGYVPIGSSRTHIWDTFGCW